MSSLGTESPRGDVSGTTSATPPPHLSASAKAGPPAFWQKFWSVHVSPDSQNRAGKGADSELTGRGRVAYDDGKKIANTMSVLVLDERCWTRWSSPPCGVTAVVDRILMLLLMVGKILKSGSTVVEPHRHRSRFKVKGG